MIHLGQLCAFACKCGGTMTRMDRSGDFIIRECVYMCVCVSGAGLRAARWGYSWQCLTYLTARPSHETPAVSTVQSQNMIPIRWKAVIARLCIPVEYWGDFILVTFKRLLWLIVLDVAKLIWATMDIVISHEIASQSVRSQINQKVEVHDRSRSLSMSPWRWQKNTARSRSPGFAYCRLVLSHWVWPALSVTCLDPLCSSFKMTHSDLELIRTLWLPFRLFYSGLSEM